MQDCRQFSPNTTNIIIVNYWIILSQSILYQYFYWKYKCNIKCNIQPKVESEFCQGVFVFPPQNNYRFRYFRLYINRLIFLFSFSSWMDFIQNRSSQTNTFLKSFTYCESVKINLCKWDKISNFFTPTSAQGV